MLATYTISTHVEIKKLTTLPETLLFCHSRLGVECKGKMRTPGGLTHTLWRMMNDQCRSGVHGRPPPPFITRAILEQTNNLFISPAPYQQCLDGRYPS